MDQIYKLNEKMTQDIAAAKELQNHKVSMTKSLDYNFMAY